MKIETLFLGTTENSKVIFVYKIGTAFVVGYLLSGGMWQIGLILASIIFASHFTFRW